MTTPATDGILEAIKQTFDQNSLIKAAGFAELYAGRATKVSAGLAFPYAIYTSLKRRRIGTTSDAVLYERPIEISLYGRTEDQVASYVELLAAAFPENAVMSLAAPYHFKLMRAGDVEYVEEGDRVWRAAVDYTVTVARDR